MHDKRMQKHDDRDAMNNTKLLECPWPPSPLWGSWPLTEQRRAGVRSQVHDPGAGLVIAGHCGLSVRGWLGPRSIQQVQEQQGEKQRGGVSEEWY